MGSPACRNGSCRKPPPRRTAAVKLDFRPAAKVRLTQAGWPPAQVILRLTVAEQLTLELAVFNATAQEFSFEDCLHTYFSVGDISQVEITGLKGVQYLDKVDQFARKLEAADAIKINSEVDRVYLNATGNRWKFVMRNGAGRSPWPSPARPRPWCGIRGRPRPGPWLISGTTSTPAWCAWNPVMWGKAKSRWHRARKRPCRWS